MSKQRQKYLLKSQYRKQIEKVVIAILENNLDDYDLVILEGYTNMYRIRVGDIRIVFEKSPSGNIIKGIGPRGDIYKML